MTKKIRIGIYNARKMNKSAVVYTLEGIDGTERNWKDAVKKSLEANGWEVVAISMSFKKENFEVVATCYQRGESPQARAEAKKKKAVTRGGTPIEGPVKIGRTMSGKVRALKTGGQ